MPASIGLTGGIGSGKSTVAAIIEAFGYPVFYSDLESKKIINNPAVLNELCGIFDENIVHNKLLDKVALAKIVFNDSKKLEQLNNLLHPKVRSAYDAWRAKQSAELVFNEAAILFETGAHTTFDKVILVVADKSIRTERIMARDEASVADVEARMSKQLPDEKKIPLADFVIDNNGDSPLTPRVKKVLDDIHRTILAK
jgi:dephospho-CoA kinase